MTIRAHDGETDITGPVIDQSHLHALLERIASLGLELRSLTPLENENAAADARPHPRQPGVDNDPRSFLWILLGIIYIACWIYFGLATLRKGHYWMFWIGFILPILWIIGIFIAPTQRAVARVASTA